MTARYILVLAALAAGLIPQKDAWGTIVPASDAVSIASPTPGLSGVVYNLQPPQYNEGQVSTTAQYFSYIAESPGNSISANYTATTLNYNGGDDVPTAAFLLGDSNGTAANDEYPIDSSLFDANGYIQITPSQLNTPLSFLTGSDDGSDIYIGGNPNSPLSGIAVVLNEGSHSFTNVVNPDVTFSQAGYYRIEVAYYNNFFNNDPAELMVALPGDIAGTHPQLFTGVVPEPSSVILLGLGMTGLLIAARRRIALADLGKKRRTEPLASCAGEFEKERK